MNLNHLNEEDRLFISRIGDLFAISQTRNIPKYIGFLNEREVFLASELIRQQGFTGCRFFGGYEGAARVVLGALPDYLQDSEASFPVRCVGVRYPKQYALSHRDFLGTLMHLNIARECVGDIVVGEGQAYLFVLEQVVPLILDEVVKIGSVGVKCEETQPPEIESEQAFEEISGTIGSERLDAVVALATRLSRQKSCELISRGLVQLQYETVSKPDIPLKEGDVFSIRGYGKYKLSRIGSLSKKGHLHITIEQYR